MVIDEDLEGEEEDEDEEGGAGYGMTLGQYMSRMQTTPAGQMSLSGPHPPHTMSTRHVALILTVHTHQR